MFCCGRGSGCGVQMRRSTKCHYGCKGSRGRTTGHANHTYCTSMRHFEPGLRSYRRYLRECDSVCVPRPPASISCPHSSPQPTRDSAYPMASGDSPNKWRLNNIWLFWRWLLSAERVWYMPRDAAAAAAVAGAGAGAGACMLGGHAMIARVHCSARPGRSSGGDTPAREACPHLCTPLQCAAVACRRCTRSPCASSRAQTP